MIIPDKETYYKLWHAGVLGNRPRSFTADELETAPIDFRVGVRYKQPGSRFQAMNLTRHAALAAIRHWCKYGAERNKFVINEMAPHKRQTIQGEVAPDWHLTYTWVKKPMRAALDEQMLYAKGVLAKELVRQYMDPSSWDWLMHLFETYPTSVVEFTCFTCYVGMIPRRNTIFWEIRTY